MLWEIEPINKLLNEIQYAINAELSRVRIKAGLDGDYIRIKATLTQHSERCSSKIEQETGTRNLLTEKDQARIRLGLNWDQPPDGSIPATDA